MTRDTEERPRRGQTPATGPRTGQVRIIGAERAADAAATPPGDAEADAGRDEARDDDIVTPSHGRSERGLVADGADRGAQAGARDEMPTGEVPTGEVPGVFGPGEPAAREGAGPEDGDDQAPMAETWDPGSWDPESWDPQTWDAEAWGTGARDAAAQRPEDAGGVVREAEEPMDEPTVWMPHWTEAPTGEVPAVLARGDEAARAARREPSWREDPNDWELDASLTRPILEEEVDDATDPADETDRQPWSFELGADSEDDGGEIEGRRGPSPTGSISFEQPARDDDVAGPGDPDPYSPWTPTGEQPAVRGREHRPGTDAPGGHGADTPAARSRGGSAPAGGDDEGTDILGGAPAADTAARLARSAGEGGLAGEEAAALAEDLETHGLRRMLERRRPEAVRGGTARHRARGAAAPAEEGARPPKRGEAAPRTGRNIPAAIGSGVLIGAIVLVAFSFGTVPAMAVVTAVIVLAAAEAYGALRRGGERPATLLGLAAVLAVLIGTYDRAFQAVPVVLVLLVAGTFLWHIVKIDAKADPLRSTAVTLLVFCWVGVFGSFAALLLAPSLFPDRHGIAYLLGALIAAAAYDVGALAVGAWIGRHPLTSISPGKTWEGVIGGGVVALAVAVGLVRLIHPWTLGETVALGIVVAVVSPIGDLSESLVKRRLGVKDMGRILPGHGGILDRVDGMLFVLPATYYLLRAFGHG